MCFSTEASFSAAVVLGAAGVATVKACRAKHLYLLSLVPFLFAIQQLSEGLIWYNATEYPLPPQYLELSVKIFLTFAMLVWPVWIPLSLAVAETVPWRKRVIVADLIVGISLSCLNLFFAFNQEIRVEVVGHSIRYLGNVPSQMILYPLIVLIPCFISSLKNIWIFGILVAIAYAIAYILYETTFVSVWCFFAALTSLVIYKIVKQSAGNYVK